MTDTLNLDAEIRADIARYNRMLELYRSRKASTGALVDGENTKQTERHLQNVVNEQLEALLRDRNA